MLRALCFSLLLCSPLAAADKPNVLFIAVDDLNHWVGYLGRNPQTKTPNIDRLAKMGVRFNRSYCAAPVCNPSRAAIMSGLRPGQTGVYDNGQNWQPAIDPSKTLTTQFLNAGYNVYGAGKIYHGSTHRDAEWTEYFEKSGGESKQFAPGVKNDGVGGIKFAPLACEDADMPDYKVVNYGLEKLTTKQDKPFFLAIGLVKPHMPWNVPQKYFDLHPLDAIQLPPTQENDLADVPPSGIKMAKPQGDHAEMLKSGRWKEAVQAYLATISFCDAMVGRLIDGLEQSAYRENTIIVFWGDHGWHLGEKEHWRKFALWEEATRAPLIFVAPGVTQQNTVCETPVDFMSVYPTLCELTGVPIPSHVKWPSIQPLLKDPAAAWTTPALCTFHLNNHSLRSREWHYIRYANGDEELYNEAADPYEWKNEAANPQYAAIKQEFLKHLPTDNVPELPSNAGGGGNKKAKNAKKKSP